MGAAILEQQEQLAYKESFPTTYMCLVAQLVIIFLTAPPPQKKKKEKRKFKILNLQKLTEPTYLW